MWHRPQKHDVVTGAAGAASFLAIALPMQIRR
jgi:hypothetical protein